jgi:predicted nicotinamide N-methyase
MTPAAPGTPATGGERPIAAGRGKGALDGSPTSADRVGMTGPEHLPAQLREFVANRTRPAPVALVPEIVLLQARELEPLWEASSRGPVAWEDSPYWAFPWAGGQALARYVLDHPATVRGRRVADFASGSGLVAIAALQAGAAEVLALDRDPFSAAAVALNAERNGLAIPFRPGDALGTPLPACEVLLAGDVFYERRLADGALGWFRELARRGVRVLAGDAWRSYAPHEGFVELAWYDVPTTTAIEDAGSRRARILEIQG